LFTSHTADTHYYTLSLHDALPIWSWRKRPSSASWSGGQLVAAITLMLIGTGRLAPTGTIWRCSSAVSNFGCRWSGRLPISSRKRSEENTSELQSRGHLVCRLLLEK